MTLFTQLSYGVFIGNLIIWAIVYLALKALWPTLKRNRWVIKDWEDVK